MQARYYDPVIGRFYSNDPAGFSNVHNFNRYAYANNNPYKYVDPDGRNAITKFVKQMWKNNGDAIQSAADVAQDVATVFSDASSPMDRVEAAVSLVSPVDFSDLKTVGRWMSKSELGKMKKTGKVQEGGGGQTRVADPSNPDAYGAAPTGDSYVEFDVPASSIKPHSQGTGRIPGPKSPDARAAARAGKDTSQFEMPEAKNIKEL
jgi:uncharacterized protein RhaS with RHS repeats